ncbi:hypothetical protein BH20ACT2_BH20ACT2_16160 [soil metagenome]
MALARVEVTDGLLAELGRFEELVRPLDAVDWERPSRCDGWTVGDVARHVIGSMADVVAGRLDGLGSPEVTEREVAERAGRRPAELADECAEVTKAAAGMLPLFDDDAWAAAAPGGYDGTLGDGIEALWYDTWLHADDIRAALGRPTELGDGLRGAVSHVVFELAKRGWHGEVPAGDELGFVLVATGRADPTTMRNAAPLNIYAA